jgi:hypothetical protein
LWTLLNKQLNVLLAQINVFNVQVLLYVPVVTMVIQLLMICVRTVQHIMIIVLIVMKLYVQPVNKVGSILKHKKIVSKMQAIANKVKQLLFRMQLVMQILHHAMLVMISILELNNRLILNNTLAILVLMVQLK